jgi:hypothetical protein
MHRAYPLQTINRVANYVISDVPVVVFVSADETTSGAFSSVVEGKTLQLSVEGERYVDDLTSSTWTAAGRAVSGELAGAQLEQIPSRATFWFAYVAAFSEVEVLDP